MECIPMPTIGIVMKSSVRRVKILFAHFARVLMAKSSWCLLREVICLTWCPRYASLRQLLNWLRKAFEPTRLCYLVDMSLQDSLSLLRLQLGEVDRARCRQGVVQVEVFGWRRNTLHVIWRRAHSASKILVWQKSWCSPRASSTIHCTCCSRSLPS